MTNQPENILNIQEELDSCANNIERSYRQYVECLKKNGFIFLTEGIRNETYYFAVHHSYHEEFKGKETNLIPDWAIKQIPRDVFLRR
jgi:hypothetical protein